MNLNPCVVYNENEFIKFSDEIYYENKTFVVQPYDAPPLIFAR